MPWNCLLNWPVECAFLLSCDCVQKEVIAVLTVEACEAKHADLVCDVVPGPWCPQSLELSFQLRPHQQDPVSHGLHILLPKVREWKHSACLISTAF